MRVVEYQFNNDWEDIYSNILQRANSSSEFASSFIADFGITKEEKDLVQILKDMYALMIHIFRKQLK